MNDYDGCDDHDLLDLASQDAMAVILSDEVAGEIAKAAPLSTEFGICLGGCLNQDANSYDMISRNLKADPARRLRRNMQAAKQAINALHLHHMDEEQPTLN